MEKVPAAIEKIATKSSLLSIGNLSFLSLVSFTTLIRLFLVLIRRIQVLRYKMAQCRLGFQQTILQRMTN